MRVPRVVVAGVTSGVGKTTVSVAIMRALHNKGLSVQSFKVGPDFIDPSYHTYVTGRQSRNLDAWMMGRDGILDCFVSACEGADVAVIEGVMGLFDGMSGKDDFASTAHVARILKAPVVLVVDAAKAARSIAAIVLGFLNFDRNIKIAGVILNNIASDRHARYVADALHDRAPVPLLGVIKRSKTKTMEERHLGLVPAPELDYSRRKAVIAMAKKISEKIEIDSLLRLCGTEPLPDSAASKLKVGKMRTRIAVALDESFNFYYADNLDALRNAGAQLVFFSPVNDRKLPDDVDGLILGGGFPEVLADRLAKNVYMIRSVRNAVHGGLPVYAECGGLMYLTHSIRGYRGQRKVRKMAGLIDGDTVMTNNLVLNYTEARSDGPLFGEAKLRGHEFHYSRIDNISRDTMFAYSLSKGKGIIDGKDGVIINDKSLASYMHLHFRGSKLAKKLVDACYRNSRR